MIKKLLKLLTPSERKRAGLLLGMIILMALLDMVGVASILPFMTVLGTPEILQTNAFLNKAFIVANNFGIETAEQFLFTLGIFSFIFLMVSLTFKAFTTYMQTRTTLMYEYSISKRLVEGYLHQSYIWFLNRHSADLGKSILSEVSLVTNSGIIPMMNLISNGIVSIALLFLLILMDPKLAIIVGLTLAFTYTLIYKASSITLIRSGKARYKANQERFKAVSEAFGAIKEIKVSGLEQVYIDRYSKPTRFCASNSAFSSLIAQLPRFAIEAIAFGGLLLILLYLIKQGGSFASSISIIIIYAFAGYKMMPALQAIYVAFTQLRYAGPGIDGLYQDLMSLQPAYQQESKPDMPLTQAIKLNHIQYSYPNAPHPAIKDLSLTIPAHSRVGLVGATGSGKSTIVDLILGLLEAQKGTLGVDDQAITKHNIRAWQRTVGYVPQQIYLADDTVSANIAFGVDTKDIDHAAVERAARIANLHEFVCGELPQQYKTTVGERGVRLSGGQRQRIGIARAMYHNPQVLILDEATSALDNLTEQAVMEAVYNLSNEITIIIIAHRLSTVKACDTIFLLEKGELKAQGTFDELAQTNGRFRAMAGTG